MKFGRDFDYHGSRSYSPEAGTSFLDGIIDHVCLLVAWSRQQLETMLRSGIGRSPETMSLIHGNERHFSLLGAIADQRKPRRVADCPFPEGPPRARRPVNDTGGGVQSGRR